MVQLSNTFDRYEKNPFSVSDSFEFQLINCIFGAELTRRVSRLQQVETRKLHTTRTRGRVHEEHLNMG